LDLFNLLIALLCEGRQIMLKAQHAVVRNPIRILFDAVLFGYPTGVIFTLVECVPEISHRVTLLAR
jgi:hypothetical protein